VTATGAEGALVVGVDCSTTAVKAIAFDARGTPVAEGRAPLVVHNPAPDAWEQDAASWLRATDDALCAMVDALGPDGAKRVAALSITHQRETFVMMDGAGEPLHAAVLWMDGRGAADVLSIASRVGRDRLVEMTGKPPCITPSMYKIARLLRERPDLAAARPWIADVGGFVLRHLTGVLATSVASADPMGIIDMRTADYADELLGVLGIERDRLAALVAPGAVVGGLTREVAAATGLSAGLPVVACAGDGQAAGVGAGITAPGRAYLNLGTAIVSGVSSDRYAWGEGFRTLFGARPRSYFLETDLKGGTFTFGWLAGKVLGAAPGDQKALLDALAEQAAALPPGADGLVVLPYFCGVMNPYWDDAASGVLFGLRGGHGPAHLYRAIAEGIALEQRLHTEHVEAAVGAIEELVVVGGPAGSDLWCQILADVIGKRIVRASTTEATALGAAVVAAAAAGLYSDLEGAVAGMTRTGRAFVPGDDRPAYDALYRSVYRGLFEDLRERMGRLEAFRLAHASRPR
jgi:xylulokinase